MLTILAMVGGDGITLVQGANTITINADDFSDDDNYISNVSYDAGTNVITFTRGGTGSLAFNGTINLSDLESTWDLQTDSGVGSKQTISNTDLVTFTGDLNLDVTNIGNTVTIAHTTSAASAITPALSGANVVSLIDIDAYGHITNLSTRALTGGDVDDNYWTLTADTGGTVDVDPLDTVDIKGGDGLVTDLVTGPQVNIEYDLPDVNLQVGSTLSGGDYFLIYDLDGGSGSGQHYKIPASTILAYAILNDAYALSPWDGSGFGASRNSIFDAIESRKFTITADGPTTSSDIHISTEKVGNVDTFSIVGGTDISTTVSGRTVTINNTGTYDNYQYWTIAADSGSENINSTDTLTIGGGTNITTSYDAGTNTLTINGTDLNTTYDLTVPAATTDIRLAGSDATNDDVTISGGTDISVTRVNAQELSLVTI
jgi:hypothetical protein